MEHKHVLNFSSAIDENLYGPMNDDLLLQTLGQHVNWHGRPLVKYDGFWCPVIALRPLLSLQKHFKASDTDIMLATLPKSGTTWLKALTFSIVNRDVYTVDQSPLLTSNPHKLMHSLELDVYHDQENPDLTHIPNPRIFSTHLPLKTLPESVARSGCKIIYICRNPLDMFVSLYHFLDENTIGKDGPPSELDEAFDMFCQGIHHFGPFWEQMLEYWTAHLENPDKVLFLKYEDLKQDIAIHIRKIAEFLGFPFSMEEERQGLIEQISTLCSFEKLKSLEVNKMGYSLMVKSSSFFRKGEVGGWTNYLTPSMAKRIKKIMEIKFEGSGLKFNIAS